MNDFIKQPFQVSSKIFRNPQSINSDGPHERIIKVTITLNDQNSNDNFQEPIESNYYSNNYSIENSLKPTLTISSSYVRESPPLDSIKKNSKLKSKLKLVEQISQFEEKFEYEEDELQGQTIDQNEINIQIQKPEIEFKDQEEDHFQDEEDSYQEENEFQNKEEVETQNNKEIETQSNKEIVLKDQKRSLGALNYNSPRYKSSFKPTKNIGEEKNTPLNDQRKRKNNIFSLSTKSSSLTQQIPTKENNKSRSTYKENYNFNQFPKEEKTTTNFYRTQQVSKRKAPNKISSKTHAQKQTINKKQEQYFDEEISNFKKQEETPKVPIIYRQQQKKKKTSLKSRPYFSTSTVPIQDEKPENIEDNHLTYKLNKKLLRIPIVNDDLPIFHEDPPEEIVKIEKKMNQNKEPTFIEEEETQEEIEPTLSFEPIVPKKDNIRHINDSLRDDQKSFEKDLNYLNGNDDHNNYNGKDENHLIDNQNSGNILNSQDSDILKSDDYDEDDQINIFDTKKLNKDNQSNDLNHETIKDNKLSSQPIPTYDPYKDLALDQNDPLNGLNENNQIDKISTNIKFDKIDTNTNFDYFNQNDQFNYQKDIFDNFNSANVTKKGQFDHFNQVDFDENQQENKLSTITVNVNGFNANQAKPLQQNKFSRIENHLIFDELPDDNFNKQEEISISKQPDIQIAVENTKSDAQVPFVKEAAPSIINIKPSNENEIDIKPTVPINHQQSNEKVINVTFDDIFPTKNDAKIDLPNVENSYDQSAEANNQTKTVLISSSTKNEDSINLSPIKKKPSDELLDDNQVSSLLPKETNEKTDDNFWMFIPVYQKKAKKEKNITQNLSKVSNFSRKFVKSGQNYRNLSMILTQHKHEHFIMNLDNQTQDLIGIYTLNDKMTQIKKIWGEGPDKASIDNVNSALSYNQSNKQFINQDIAFNQEIDAVCLN